jgi:hypothetical protein
MRVGMRSTPQHLANRMEPNTHPFDPSEYEGASLKSDNRSTLDDSNSSHSQPIHTTST